MRYEQIVNHEEEFNSSGIDSHGKVFDLSQKTLSFDSYQQQLEYTKLTPASGDETYYYRTKFPKDQVVLHYTLGYLKGDIASLTQADYHVSVPFVIGRNGVIYNLFHSGFWAYHLGPYAIGGNSTRSKRTIGIELSNIGPLNLTNEGMNTYYTSTYCNVGQAEAYVHQNFRRFAYYATFTNAQYNSLIVLLRYLVSKYEIAPDFLNETERYVSLDDISTKGGIVSHVNYRKTGKEDIGPAFDWERVITGVLAPNP